MHDSKVYTFFSTNRDKTPTGSGMYEIDGNTGEYKLLFGSRRRPARTILDDCTPYFDYFPDSNTYNFLNGKYILFELYVDNKKRPTPVYYFIYDISTGLVHNLKDMSPDFFINNVHSFSISGKSCVTISFLLDSCKIRVVCFWDKKIYKILKNSELKRIDIKTGKYPDEPLIRRFLLFNDPQLLLFYRGSKHHFLFDLNKKKRVINKHKVEFYYDKSKIKPVHVYRFIMDTRGLYIKDTSNSPPAIIFYSRKSIEEAFRKQQQEE